jgi:hypothetical protein
MLLDISGPCELFLGDQTFVDERDFDALIERVMKHEASCESLRRSIRLSKRDDSGQRGQYGQGMLKRPETLKTAELD